MRQQSPARAEGWPASADPGKWQGVTMKGGAKVTALNLSGVPLKTLPAATSALKNLEILELRGCGLAAVPADVWRLPKLGRVDLKENALAAIPPEVEGAKALRVLDMRGNKIATSSKKLQIALEDKKVKLEVDANVAFS
jgi:Leucine-rich repeat (LRR) protein